MRDWADISTAIETEVMTLPSIAAIANVVHNKDEVVEHSFTLACRGCSIPTVENGPLAQNT